MCGGSVSRLRRGDPQFENNLRRAVHEVRILNSPNIQTATNMAPINGGQLIATIGPGASLNDAVINQGTIDQSTNSTTHDRRRTTHKRGISALSLIVIAVVVGLVVAGGMSYLIVSINHPAWFEELFGSSSDEVHPRQRKSEAAGPTTIWCSRPTLTKP